MFFSQLETVCTLPKLFPLFRLQDFLAIQIWYFQVDFSMMQQLLPTSKQMYLDHLLQLTTELPILLAQQYLTFFCLSNFLLDAIL